MVTEHDEDPSSAAASSAAPSPAADPGPEESVHRATDAARPADPARRALLLTPIVAIIVGLVVVLATLPRSERVPLASSAPSADVIVARGDGYLVSSAELRERGRLAAAGQEPYASAVTDLIDWANAAVDDGAQPVQPLLILGTDGPFVDDARRAYGLALAYGLTGEERYAVAARRTIRAWVDTTKSTADTCPDSGGCHTSLIIGRAGAGFALGADLLDGSDAWSEDDVKDLQEWMRAVLIPAASHRPNNWGDAGTFLRVVAADYAGDKTEFDAAIARWRSLIDLIEPDGRIPEEVRRGTAGISYTHEALQYKIAVARIAERRGMDLWDYVGTKGGSLRAAVDRLAYYWFRPEAWPDDPAAVVPSTGPLWEIAYAHWQDARWEPIILDDRPFGDRGHSAIRWTTLTNGIPFASTVASGPSPSASAGTSAAPTTQPTPTPSPTPMSSASTPVTAAMVPPVTGLSVRLRSPLGDRIPVTIRWDAFPASVSAVEIQRRVGEGDWTSLDVASSGRSARDDLRPRAAYDYRVRAVIDRVAGAWAPLDDVTVERVELSASGPDQDGAWFPVRLGAYSAGKAVTTEQRGATIRWEGTVRELAVVGPTGPTRGRMIIDVDGKRADVVELYATHYRPRVVLFEDRWSKPGVHEVRIEARARDGRRTVAIDDLVILSSAVTAGPGS